MADSLYPTKTRLYLLAAISNGQVMADVTGDTNEVLLFPDAPTSWQDRQKVTARVRELERAGWVAEWNVIHWNVTEAGRKVLADRVLSTAGAS